LFGVYFNSPGSLPLKQPVLEVHCVDLQTLQETVKPHSRQTQKMLSLHVIRT